jgi:type IV pilus assembly protein PilZ
MFTLVSEETYQDGQIIVKEGNPGDWVYVILSGNVEIFKDVSGKKVVIELLKQGEIFGELGFLGSTKRTATARAVGPTQIGLIDKASLDTEYNKLSSEFRSILLSIVERFIKMVDKMSQSPFRMESRQQKAVALTYKDRNSFSKAYTGNISGGGLFVKTDNPLTQGEKFLLHLNLPGQTEPIKIDCEVAWVRKMAPGDDKTPAGMGIKFLDMGPKERTILVRYIQEISNP